MKKLRQSVMRIATGFGLDSARVRIPWGSSLFCDLRRFGLLPQKRSTIFDIGANTGQTATVFARRCPESDLWCFEPCTESFRELQRNVAHLKNIKVHQLAFGEKDGETLLKIFGDSVLNQLVDADSADTISQRIGEERVTINRLDSFCQTNNVDSIDLLKIDTEGFDAAVLRGAERMLRDRRIRLVYCEVGFGYLSRFAPLSQVTDLLHSHGMCLVGLYEQIPSLWLQTTGIRLDLCNALFARQP